MADEARASWREQRGRAVAAHAAADQRRRDAEAAQAQELVAGFARQALARGLPLTRLTARPHHGRFRYRTRLRGWYLNTARTLAVSEDGGYYILDVPPSLRSWLFGATVPPERPRLVIGVGARDGESIRLAALLERRLSSGGLSGGGSSGGGSSGGGSSGGGLSGGA